MGSDLKPIPASGNTILLVALSLAIAVAVWLAELIPGPLGPQVRAVLGSVGPVGVLLAVLLLVIVVAAFGIRARRPFELPVVRDHEPLLVSARVPALLRASLVISVLGTEPSAGSSTLAFNLAVLVATEGELGAGGERRRPRSICLLADGPMTSALAIDSRPLLEYISDHPARMTEEVLAFAAHHPSGCELLCLSGDRFDPQHLRLLVPVLRRFYDLVVLDCPFSDRWLTASALELADGILGVSLPSIASATAVGRWADRIWALGLEAKTVLVRNRRIAGAATKPDHPFLFGADLPDDPAIEGFDANGLPWCLDRRLPAATELLQIAGALMPTLFAKERQHAA
jgi:cellulose biosynthesis protein BcsQ